MRQLTEKISEIPFLYKFLRNVLNGGTFRKRIKPLIGVREHEKVLDICCGLGEYSLMFRGEYVGVDFDKRYIDYAVKKYGSQERKFICQDIRKIDFDEKYFDRAIMINAVHHFSDEENLEIFKKVASLIKDEFIIVDADLNSSNFFQKILLRLDKGVYLRSLEEHKLLASRVFKVKEVFSFSSRTKSVALCLLKCTI